MLYGAGGGLPAYNNKPAAYSYADNYVNYGGSRGYSENNLLQEGGSSKFVPNYSSPYLQSVSPVSEVMLGGGGHWEGGYNSSGRFNAVAHSLHHSSTEVDLNESSVGTHV